MPSVGAVLQRARGVRRRPRSPMSAASDSAGNVEVSGRPPASEMTSGRSVIAIRSRIADDFMTARARGEQAGVALEVAALARPGAAPCAALRRLRLSPGAAARRLQSWPPRPYRTMKLVLDILQGAGLGAAAGLRPFLPALLAGALAAADLGIDFDGTDFAFLEAPWFLAGRWPSRSSSRSLLRARLGDRRPARPPSAASAIGLGALLFAGVARRPLATSGGPGIIGGAACALRSPAAAARVAADAHAARASTPRPRRALPLYAEGAALLARRRSRRSSRRWRSSRSASSSGCCVGGPPARGREVRRPAHPAVSARPSSSSPSSTASSRRCSSARSRPAARRRSQAVMERGTYVDELLPPRSPRSRRCARRRSPPGRRRTATASRR